MKMTDLRRAEPEPAKVPEFPDVALRARDVLGYQPSSLRPVATVSTEVRAALADIGLRPFRTEDVERYQRSQEGTPVRAKVALWLGAAAFALSIVAGIVLGIACKEPTFAFLIVPGGVMLWFGTMYWSESSRQRWGRAVLSEYHADVPTYALETALALKERLPDAKFHVDYLTETPRDPFLVMTHGGGPDLYLEVWDEPGFGTKRAV